MCDAFKDIEADSGEPVIQCAESLLRGLKLLALPELSRFETEEMIEAGMSCHQICQSMSKSDLEKSELMIGIPVHFLISGSNMFRQLVMKLKTDPIYCALLKTDLIRYMSETHIKKLSHSGRELCVDNVGKTIFDSERGDKAWCVLLSGKLRAIIRTDEPQENSSCEILEGGIFGGYNPPDNPNHFRVEVVRPCRYIEFGWELLESLDKLDRDSTEGLLSILGGTFSFA